jgi:hypothetical protein
MPVDFLSLIGTVLNNRQRAADSALSAQQFNRDLAFRGNESALARAAREREIASQLGLDQERIGLDKQRLAQDEALKRAALAQEQSQFGSRLGFDYSRLGQEGSQFGQNLTQRQTEANREYELNQLQQQLAREAAAQRQTEMLAELATKFNSPDILNLIGGRIGLPGLGMYTRGVTGNRKVGNTGIGGHFGTTPSSTVRYSYDGGKTWDRPPLG